jgi:mannose-6-phosphate isomerase class I
MQLTDFPLSAIDWSSIPPVEHKGVTGLAYWRVQNIGTMRIRMVQYTAGYLADHWCSKGHIVLCVEGDMTAEHQGGPQLAITAGMSYLVADNAEPHRWSTVHGAKVFIVD